MRSLLVAAALALALVVLSASDAEALSKKQIRVAKKGVPAAAARWAPIVNMYWDRWLKKYKGRRLTVPELHKALLIIWRESRGNPRCVGPAPYYCRGLFQLLPGHARGKWDLFKARVNASLAGMLYVRLGWRPWASTAY